MRIQHLSVAEALWSLGSRPQGLTQVEAARRLAEYGPNRVERLRVESWPLQLVRQFTHFFALLLWVAAGLAFFAETRHAGEGMATLGIAIVGVIVVNGAFSFWQERRAERAIVALQELLPHQVKALRDGGATIVEASEIVPGDVVILAEGDEVPADARLIETHGVRVNIATVTGEPYPKARSDAPDPGDDILQGTNLVLAGTTLVSGEARAVVFATGMRTEFGKIAHLTQTAGEVRSPLQREIARLSRIVAALATLLGVVFFVVGRAAGLPFWDTFIFAIGIIVANVPEGLLPTVTLAMAMGSQRMARRNTVIRHLPSVETLGSASVICTDKTGTLTQNRMRVVRIFVAQADGTVGEVPGDRSLASRHRRLAECALHCESVQERSGSDDERFIGDPMEVALVETARAALGSISLLPRLDEVPFDADRKRMSTLHRESSGAVLFTKGAPERVVPLCARVETPSGDETWSPQWAARFREAADAMADSGLRVLALAWRPVELPWRREALERELVLAGIVGLEDPPRPEVPAAVKTCVEAGLRVIMVTGDHPHTALAIGREIGLVRSSTPRVVLGDQLQRMSGTQLQIALDAPEIVFARTGADHKMRIVRALQRKGHVVAVTGDGVNDAPALRAADIGIAMGRSGTDVAREAADMVLLDDNFASIVAAVEEGRAVFDNIRKFMTYILTSNVPEIVPYLAFVLLRVPLALTIVQILAVDLGTDMVPALGLGAEPPHAGVMKRPPRPRRRRLVDGALLSRAYLFLGPIQAALAMAGFFLVLKTGGWVFGTIPAASDPTYPRATAACFAVIVITQIANVFNCRSATGSVAGSRLFGNRLILLGIVVEIGIVLAIVYSSVGNALFATAPFAASVWAYAVAGAALLLVLEEARKAVIRRRIAGSTGA